MQFHPEAAARPYPGSHPHLTAQTLDSLFHDGQPHTGPLIALARIQGLKNSEYALMILGVDADAGRFSAGILFGNLARSAGANTRTEYRQTQSAPKAIPVRPG